MSESKRKLVVFAIFVLAVTWGIYNQPWKSFGSSIPHPNEGHSPDTVGASTATIAPIDGRLERSNFLSDWTVDPFRSRTPTVTSAVAVVVTEQGSMPSLQGTMIVGNESVCVIGGQILKKGDRFGGWRIDAVVAEQVEITRLSDHRHLTLRAGKGAGTERR